VPTSDKMKMEKKTEGKSKIETEKGEVVYQLYIMVQRYILNSHVYK